MARIWSTAWLCVAADAKADRFFPESRNCFSIKLRIVKVVENMAVIRCSVPKRHCSQRSSLAWGTAFWAYHQAASASRPRWSSMVSNSIWLLAFDAYVPSRVS